MPPCLIPWIQFPRPHVVVVENQVPPVVLYLHMSTMACAKPTHLPPSTHTHARIYNHEEYYLEKGVYRTRLQCRDCRAPAAAISVHVH